MSAISEQPTGPAPGPAAASQADAVEPTSVVGPESARFEGLLTFRGCARVDGEVEGEILCRGRLYVGERARVVGIIEADELVVAGVIEGDAIARTRLELTATARVRGTIRSPRLQLADGCVLEGRCETLSPAPPAVA